MNENEATEVREAMVLPGWEWRAGMRVASRGDAGWRLCGDGPGAGALCTEGRTPARRDPVAVMWWRDPLGLPDPHDDATAGAMLAMLSRHLTVRRHRSGWIVDIAGAGRRGEASSLGMAAIRCAIARGRWGGGTTDTREDRT